MKTDNQEDTYVDVSNERWPLSNFGDKCHRLSNADRSKGGRKITWKKRICQGLKPYKHGKNSKRIPEMLATMKYKGMCPSIVKKVEHILEKKRRVKIDLMRSGKDLKDIKAKDINRICGSFHLCNHLDVFVPYLSSPRKKEVVCTSFDWR